MIGGYKMIDLSTVTIGTQATISGIYDRVSRNNSKPLMIKTPDGQSVFAEVKAGTNKYVTAYLGADGSTYTVEISNADKVDITKQESSSELDGRVDDIEERLNANKMIVASRTLLDDYNDPNTPFTCPSDGYVNFKVQGTIGNKYNVTIYDPGSTGAQAIQAKIANSGAYDQFYAVFVKKGMRLVCSENIGTGNYGYFIPLES